MSGLNIAVLLVTLLTLGRAAWPGEVSLPSVSLSEVASKGGHTVGVKEPIASHHSHYEKPRLPSEVSRFAERRDLKLGRRTPRHLFHKVVFARKQRNVAVLKAQLMDVSDPKSRNYGKHVTKKFVAGLSSDDVSTKAIERFLQTHQARVVRSTRYNDYVIAEAPVGTWEDLFQAEFFDVSHKNDESVIFIRCLNYTIPAELVEHISTVFNTVQLPDHHYNKRIHLERASRRSGTLATGATDPDLLNQFYNIQNNTGNALTDQAVYAILDQTFSPSDLTQFQGTYNLPVQSIASDVGDHVSDTTCVNNPNDCIEANLDVQYIMAVARSVPTIYYYWTGEDVWLDWIIEVADMEDPPDLFTISYGSYEAAFSPGYLEAFDIEAIKLGLVGTTLLAASGDDGVSGFLTRDGRVSCGYYASYPASSPYVTAVGGTMGPEYGDDEVACQSDGGSSITTGGGFSHYHDLPSWQADHVEGYFDRVRGTNKQPVSGYDPTKRGYPDVSLMANNYGVITGGSLYYVSGTSASSPVMAGMVSLVNSARRERGRSTLGWLNPALYQMYTSFTNDITSGDNKCLVNGYGCCAQGFYATDDWDPVSGLGSINFELFKAAMLGINPNPDVDSDESMDKEWVLVNGYGNQECSSEGDLTSQSGYPVGVCLVEYDNLSTPVSSAKYACNSAIDRAIRYRYADLHCNASQALDHEVFTLGCRNFAPQTSIVQSVDITCASSADLPLPVGTFAVERRFNAPEGCALNRTSSFNSWRTEHCFSYGEDRSFQIARELTATSYNDSACNATLVASEMDLPTECTAVESAVEAGEELGTSLSYLFFLSHIKEDRAKTILGMSYTTVAAIAIVIVCLALIMVTYCCYTSCRNGGTHRATHEAVRREPIVCTVAQVSAPEYQEVPVVVAYVPDRGAVQMV